MVGVAEHDTRAHARRSPGVSPFTVPLVPTGMKVGVSTAPRGVRKSAGSRLAVSRENLYGYRRPYRARPPFRISMASPKEKKR